MRYYIYTLAILFYAQFLLAQNAKDHPLIVDIQLNDRLQMQVNASIAALYVFENFFAHHFPPDEESSIKI